MRRWYKRTVRICLTLPILLFSMRIRRFRHWLPLGVITLFAGLTYGLFLLNLPPTAILPKRPKTHTPDYFADHFSVTILNPQGTTQYRIKAVKMVHYEDDETIDITLPALRIFTPNQPEVTSFAQRGQLNADGSIVDLYGDARVLRAGIPGSKNNEPAIQVTSEHFRVLIHDDLVQTEKPVTIQRGRSIARATGMEYNNTTRVLRFKSRVQGVFSPSETPDKASLPTR